MKTIDLLKRKLELQKAPFYSKPNNKWSAKDMADNDEHNKIEAQIQANWPKYPNWLNESMKNGSNPYTPATKLPTKGTPVSFITCDRVKDKSDFFGFKLVNYRVEKGTFHGMKIVKDNGSDYCRPCTLVKVAHKDGYIYTISPNDVVPA